MKLKAFVKVAMISIIKQFPIFVFVFMVFPIALGVIMSYILSDSFTQPSNIKPIMITIKDEDNSKASKTLIEFFNSNEMKKIIEIKEDGEKIKLEILIPNGYENSLMSLKEFNIEINEKDSGTKRSSTIISGLLDKYNEEISYQYLIKRNIDNKDISQQEKEELFQNINNEIKSVYSASLIEGSIIKTRKNFTSYEYYSITFLGFLFIMLIMTLASSQYIETEIGISRRIMSTAITRTEYFNYGLVSIYIMAVIFNLLYVFGYRVMGLSFKGSIPLLILITFVQSILVTAVTGFFMAFFKKKSGTIVMNTLLIYQIVAGGMFMSQDSIRDNVFLRTLGKYSPDVLINKAYKNFLIYNSLESTKLYLCLIIIVAILFYIVSLIKVRIKWGNE
ncbi:ABC transporter permease [Oceanirhabdus sp. W0125-5]|uniref:ABC transporter permease n=1 Tax=Oceanirhabdus sp. W0125-5 TaxID=2999116 RepID=UPI0022F3326F|nr:ABC transporter permease [Oceanirhabdus sp. W0125-5]WBW97065.1 ABC transporter permease [Oceanirhabdus sp. W0125-5]